MRPVFHCGPVSQIGDGMVPERATLQGAMRQQQGVLLVLLLLLLLPALSTAVDDCDFRYTVQKQTRQLVLTCQCNISTVYCSKCTRRVQKLYIDHDLRIKHGVNVTEVQPTSTDIPPSSSKSMQKTYQITVNRNLLLSTSNFGVLTFVCAAKGMSYDGHAKDEDHKVSINLSEFLTVAANTSNTTTTTTTTTTTPQPTTEEPPSNPSSKLPEKAAATTTTSPRPPPPSLYRDHQLHSQRVVDREPLQGVSWTMMLLVIACSALLILTFALIAYIIASRRNRRKQKRVTPADPPFCGRQRNNDLRLNALTHLLTSVITSRPDEVGGHHPPQPLGSNTYDEPENISSGSAEDDTCSLTDSRSSGAYAAFASLPTEIIRLNPPDAATSVTVTPGLRTGPELDGSSLPRSSFSGEDHSVSSNNYESVG